MTPLSQLAIQKAKSFIGATEKPPGSNWGHPIQDWLERVKIHTPASWCMAFVYSIFDDAAKELLISNPLVRTGGCLWAWDHAANNRVNGIIQPGDIFIQDHGQGLGHTGIVIVVDRTTLHTIEGNSNNDGSRNGVMVVEHIRLSTDRLMKGYLRY